MGWDARTGELDIEFVGGGVYRYRGVSESDDEAILRSPSRGRAFARVIRPGTPAERIG